MEKYSDYIRSIMNVMAKTLKIAYTLSVGLSLLMLYTSCQSNTNTSNHVTDDDKSKATLSSQSDTLVQTSDTHYVDGYPALAGNELVNAVIEIPTGTVAKWEVDKMSGHLKWTLKDGAPRNVSYLGYPGNYGMIPQTLLDKKDGGDGDPLDVIILGPSIARGQVVACRLVGVIELLDSGEQDDKLIAIDPRSAFSNVHSIADLRTQFPGVVEILETWFKHYKGSEIIDIKSLGEAERANAILEQAMKGYESAKSSEK